MVMVASEVRKKRSSSAGGDPCYGSLCRPPNVFQTSTEPSKSESTAITMASNWSAWDCHNAVILKDATDIAIENHK